MGTVFIVGVDGSEGSERAAQFAARRARAEGARLILAHIVNWSPHEGLAMVEMETRHADREKEIEAAREKLLDPLREKLAGEDLTIDVVVRHGHAAEALGELAEEVGAEQVFSGRRGTSRVRALLFGSVSSSLVQMCPVPLTVVP